MAIAAMILAATFALCDAGPRTTCVVDGDTFWLEGEKRFVTLRVSTRGLRTIEKRGVDVVVAELRAKGMKI